MNYYNDRIIMISSMKQEDSSLIYDELLSQNWHPSVVSD